MTNAANIPYDQMDAPTKAAFWRAANDVQPAVSAHAPACFEAMQKAAEECRDWKFSEEPTPREIAECLENPIDRQHARLCKAVANWEELYFDSIDRMNAANERRKVPLGEQTGPQTKGTDHV